MAAEEHKPMEQFEIKPLLDLKSRKLRHLVYQFLGFYATGGGLHLHTVLGGDA